MFGLLKDLVDATRIHIKVRRDAVLKLTTPMSQPNLDCVIESELTAWSSWVFAHANSLSKRLCGT